MVHLSHGKEPQATEGKHMIETDWTAPALDRFSVGMLVTAEEADALGEIGEWVEDWQIGEPPA